MQQAARFLMERAALRPIEPFGVTSSGIIRKIEAILGSSVTVLNELEAWILITAACLPHLVDQLRASADAKLTPGQLEQIVTQLSEESTVPPVLLQQVRDAASDMCAVVNARFGFDRSDSTYLDHHLRGTPVRRQVLSAVLHLAHVIHLDQHVDPRPPDNLTSLTDAEQVRWWKQAYVSSVTIENQRLTLHVRLPRDHVDEYRPILVEPLEQDIHSLVWSYDDLLHMITVALVVSRSVVVAEDVSAIPRDVWSFVKREIETQQARKAEHLLQHNRVRVDQQRELLVRAEISQAEQMLAEGRHRDAATMFIRVSALLTQAHAIYQAEDVAIRAAQAYAQCDDGAAAAAAYLQAADVILDRSLTPQVAWRSIDQARALIQARNEPALTIQLLLTEARFEFAALNDHRAKQRLEQARQQLREVYPVAQRLQLLQAVALQHAVFAMVWEEWDTTQQVLETALADCPATEHAVRLELFKQLLVLYAERGNREAADQVYSMARESLGRAGNERVEGVLRMHYAACLARQGRLDDAYTHFGEAINRLEAYGDYWLLALAYQNMNYLLRRNGAISYREMEQHERRRLDLFITNEVEDIGAAHQDQATTDLIASKHRGALIHLRHALAYSWRVGSWLGIEQAYATLARLCVATNHPVEAVLNAIRSGNQEPATTYAVVLRDQGTVQQLTKLVDEILGLSTSVAERAVATAVLGVLADVIPVMQRAAVVGHLVGFINHPEVNHADAKLLREAAQAFGYLASQWTRDDTAHILHIALEHLQQQHSAEVFEALLQLIYQGFMHAHAVIDPPFFATTADRLLEMAPSSEPRSSVEEALVQVAHYAPTDVRQSIVTYFRSLPDPRLHWLAFLGEPLTEQELCGVLERAERSMNPQPKSVEENGRRTLSIPMSGFNPRSLNTYNDVLPPPLYNRMINALLGGIINEHNSLGMRSSAIWALSYLPIAVIGERADEIADYLLWGAEGSLPRSSMIEREVASQTDHFASMRFNTGNVEHVRRSSLSALGRMYPHLIENKRQAVEQVLISASRDASGLVRQGAAMALDAIGSVLALPPRLLRRLFILLHDHDNATRGWASRAGGCLIAHGFAGDDAEELLTELLATVDQAMAVDIRVGVAVGLRAIADGTWGDQGTRERVDTALATLAQDVSFKVRRAALS